MLSRKATPAPTRQGLAICTSKETSAADASHAAALCRLTQHLIHVDMFREPGQQLAGWIREEFVLDAVAIFDRDLSKTYTAGEWYVEPENQLLNICMFERCFADRETGLTAEVVRIGSLPIGALMVRGEIDRAFTHSIANLIAITFDRYHSRANLSRVESARETERLRSTVLDSLAHTYKTPLTAIRAAASGVPEVGPLSGAQRELIGIIAEQTELLSDLTMRLLTTAKIEHQNLHLQVESIAVEALVEDAVSEIRAQHPHMRLGVSVVPEDFTLRGDRTLLAAMLSQFLDNAAKYSEFDSRITLSFCAEGNSVLFSVHNFGPAIPPHEIERIFERYVRGSAAEKNTSGTGLGLSIARAAAQAHAGEVWATSDAVAGTTFWASLPVERSEGAYA